MSALFLEFGARNRPQDLWPFLVSETRLKFLIWTQGEIHPGQPGSCEEALKDWKNRKLDTTSEEAQACLNEKRKTSLISR